jgi:hypothetical protein
MVKLILPNSQTIFLLGSWYTKEELGARNALFVMCGTLGTMMR